MLHVSYSAGTYYLGHADGEVVEQDPTMEVLL